MSKVVIGEKKSRRVNFMFQPSVYEKFHKIATIQQTYPNAILGQFMIRYIQEHEDLLEQYEKIFGEHEENK